MATKTLILCCLLVLVSVFSSCQLEVSSPIFRDYPKNSAHPVCNVNTSLNYSTIQEAIDAPETSSGDTITVESGTYFEHITLNKSLKILGEDPETTIIDGGGVGTILHITADGVWVSGFTFNNSGQGFPPLDCGIFMDYCSGCNVSYNVVTYCRYGIYLLYSYSNILIGNNVSECYEDGLWLYHSGNNVLAENMMLNNRYGFGVFGNDFDDFNNTVDVDNLVNGKPVWYLIGVSSVDLNESENVGCICVINGYQVNITGLTLTKNGHGVFCWNTTKSRIENVTALENNYGIYLQNSNGNEISHNLCVNNWVGVSLEGSSLNRVENNTVSDSEKGISLYNANENNATGNNILNNFYGVRLFSSSYNSFFRNSILMNSFQVDLINSYQNYWDDGSKGNYWSDYLEMYPNASEVDGSGVWDTPYIIDGTNQDNYPIVPESLSPVMLELFILFFTGISLIKRRKICNSE